MRIFSNDNEYIGTPQELKEFFNNNPSLVKQEIETTDNPFPIDDFASLQDVVSESEGLRRKLAEDPNYNPFGGVVKGNEPTLRDESPVVSAELDTGVDYK